MKKCIFVLALLLFAAPALARVDIWADWTHAGTDSREVKLFYKMSAGDSNLPRAFALDIATSNDANIVEVNNISSDFWVFPGSVVIIDGDFNQPGTPVANPSQHSDTEPGLDSNGITIEMGSLHYPPEQASVNAPDSNGLLLSFKVDKTCGISLSTNAARSGVVLYDASSVAPNTTGATVDCACPGDTNADIYMNSSDMVNVYLKLNANSGSPIPKGDALWEPCYDTNGDDWINSSDMVNIYLWLNANGGSPILTPCKL